MRVSYRTHRSQCCGTVHEQIGPLKFCCADMRRLWGNLIGFGVKGIPLTSNRKVNILSLHRVSAKTLIPSVADIQYCPWCAEKIVVRCVKEKRELAKYLGVTQGEKDALIRRVSKDTRVGRIMR